MPYLVTFKTSDILTVVTSKLWWFLIALSRCWTFLSSVGVCVNLFKHHRSFVIFFQYVMLFIKLIDIILLTCQKIYIWLSVHNLNETVYRGNIERIYYFFNACSLTMFTVLHIYWNPSSISVIDLDFNISRTAAKGQFGRLPFWKRWGTNLFTLRLCHGSIVELLLDSLP